MEQEFAGTGEDLKIGRIVGRVVLNSEPIQ
jgi:hypothetical protein